MAELIVRNLSRDLVRKLEERARRHGRSVEEEHREILRRALRPGRDGDPKTVLLDMPDIGDDTDFDRIRDLPRRIDL